MSADGNNRITDASPKKKNRNVGNTRYMTRSEQKAVLDRTLFSVFGVMMVVFLGILYWILAVDSDYRAVLEHVEAASAEEQSVSVPGIPQPDDAFYSTVITFGGVCTPASMLGSSAFGTFNLMYAENGGEYFLDKLSGFFDRDDLTFLGCGAVFSDNEELAPSQNGLAEWYRAPSSAADVFSLGGVDAVSTECYRIGDYGEEGIADTKSALEASGVRWGGGGNDTVIELTGGAKAVICSFTYTDGCEAEVTARIESAAQEYGAVFVYITDRDDSYTVSDAKRAAYRSFIDAGADAVIGSCGSKMQCIENYGTGTIAYSLGALLDGSSKYPEKYTSLLRVTIRVADGEVMEILCEPVPVITYSEKYSWRPYPAEDGGTKDNILSFLSGLRDTPN